MGRVNDTISNVNAAFRNLLLAILVGGAGVGGYKLYDIYNAPNQKLADKEAELKKTNEDLAARQKEVVDLSSKLDRLQVAMNLLKVHHRLARLKVLDQHEVPALNPVTPEQGT